MNDIPLDKVEIFTESIKKHFNCTNSGIHGKSHKQEIKIKKRNADFCSVYTCKSIAIDKRLDLISFLLPTKKIWILTDSKSAVQHLAKWHNVRDFTGMNILKKQKNLSRSHQIHMQW